MVRDPKTNQIDMTEAFLKTKIEEKIYLVLYQGLVITDGQIILAINMLKAKKQHIIINM